MWRSRGSTTSAGPDQLSARSAGGGSGASWRGALRGDRLSRAVVGADGERESACHGHVIRGLAAESRRPAGGGLPCDEAIALVAGIRVIESVRYVGVPACSQGTCRRVDHLDESAAGASELIIELGVDRLADRDFVNRLEGPYVHRVGGAAVPLDVE